MIYKTFKEWAAGLWLEDGEPRKQAYTREELLLIEMGWNYGKDAGAAAEREACAKLLEITDLSGLKADPWLAGYTATMLSGYAKAIRARGQE